jgi:NAD(P)-dependent dehydrogenase (short-subunit alcohol dehydrogenase family)
MKMNPFDLSGRVAVVTGANTGIGQAIAIALAQAGADVALVGRTPAEDTAAAIRDLGRRALIVSADLSSSTPLASGKQACYSRQRPSRPFTGGSSRRARYNTWIDHSVSL